MPERANTTAERRILVGAVPAAAQALQVRSALAEVRRAVPPVVQVLTGPRGAGKTQVAAAYCRARMKDGWGLIAWINAETKDSLLLGMRDLADAAGIADPEGDSETSAKKARHWLELYSGDGLMVFDNAEDVDLIQALIPSTGRVQVIVTSVHQVFGHVGRRIEVNAFTEQESLAFLRERTGLDDPQGARAMIEEAGRLPLGLAQAASLIENQRLDYETYLERFRSMPAAKFLPHPAGDPYLLGAVDAILLSVEAVEASDTTGYDTRLMQMLSVLSPDGVDRRLLRKLAEPSLSTQVSFDSCLAALAEASLVIFSVSGRNRVRLHRLIARVIRDREVARGSFDEVVDLAAQILERQFVWDDKAYGDLGRDTELGEQTVEHVDALWKNSMRVWPHRDRGPLLEKMLRLRTAAVGYLAMELDNGRAIRIGDTVGQDCRSILGSDHPITLAAQHHLATVNRRRGRLDTSLALLEDTRDRRTRVLGADHPDTLSTLDCLATTYRAKGRLAEAIDVHKQVIDRREKVLGELHRDTLTARNNLAYAYRLSGRIRDAIALYESTLDSRVKVLGPYHRDTLNSRTYLASAYRSAGRLKDAIALYEQTVADYEQKLGSEHTDTVRARNNLALAYRAGGRIAEAIVLHQRCVQEWGRSLGGDHPWTLECRNDLAFAYHSAGQYAKAIELRDQLLTEYERTLTMAYPDALTCLHDQGWTYRMAGRVSEAVQLHEQALKERRRVLGPEHPATLSSWEHLGLSYLAAGREHEAVETLQQAAAERERVLGAEHPQTLTSKNSLADAYREVGRVADAATLQERLVDDRSRILDANHPRTLLTQVELGETYRCAGRVTEAVAKLEKAHGDTIQVLGPDHPHSLHAGYYLAKAYCSAGMHAESIALLTNTLSRQRSILGASNPDTVRTLLELSSVLAETGHVRRAKAAAQRAMGAMEECESERGLDPRHPLRTAAQAQMQRVSKPWWRRWPWRGTSRP